jgi:16S rRNA (cytosine967-C5)-methyltransferase
VTSRRSTTGARALAREVLARVDRDAAYANLALAGALDRHPGLASPERALATELVYGVLRMRRPLDHALSRHMRRPLERVDRAVLDALRVAAYQILFLERVPAHAAVDEAVGAIRCIRGQKVGGFANAVLRRLCAQDLTHGLPDDRLERLAVEVSLPHELLCYLARDMGEERAAALARAWNQRAGLTVRVNPTRTTVSELRCALEREGARVREGRWVRGALAVSGLAQPFRTESYLTGLWSVQDEAAQLAVTMLDPQPDDEILDACAGVGGKSLQIAELLATRSAGRRGAGCLLCIDASARKLELLEEHRRRLGLSCAICRADLTKPETFAGRLFNKVLLDAPCSGLGVLRRHPELKWRWQADRVDELVRLQRRLLTGVAQSLRPGGVLVYSVCTVTSVEGPGQVQWFLERHREFRALQPAPCVADDLHDGVHVRTWPQHHGTDGFFIARFQKGERDNA